MMLFRKTLDTVQPLRLLVPEFSSEDNRNNEIYREDANKLIRKISFDVLYIDPHIILASIQMRIIC